MTDDEIIREITSLCDCNFVMENGCCTALSFYDDTVLFGSTIRHNPRKQVIVQLAAQLSGLQVLNLRKAKLGSLPLFWTNSLREVDLSCNDLTDVPMWLYNQGHLTGLNLGSNALAYVPAFDAELTTLKLHKNPIETLERLPATLKLLNLYMTRQAKIPDSVFNMHELEAFTFGLSSMTDVPPLGQLSKLRYLVLASCQFSKLPDDITSLPQLTRLILAKNKLEGLPENIGELQSLRALSLYRNCISQLPSSFYNLRLSQLNVVGNPLSDPRVQDVFGGISYIRM